MKVSFYSSAASSIVPSAAAPRKRSNQPDRSYLDGYCTISEPVTRELNCVYGPTCHLAGMKSSLVVLLGAAAVAVAATVPAIHARQNSAPPANPPATRVPPLPQVKVSADKTHTVVNGQPILFLGDTCWLIQQKMNREAIQEYLDHRQAQGFNAIGIQMDFGWSGGGRDVNGNCPYLNPNGTALNPDYWSHTSCIVDQVARRGMYVFFKASAMEVRDYRWCMGGTGIKNTKDAYAHGRLLGEWFGRRGQMSNIVWMMSYDRTISGTSPEAARMRAQAEGIADGNNGVNRFDGEADYSTVFMTFHPAGPGTSAEFQPEPWLDAAGVQMRHGNVNDVHLVLREFKRHPQKPVLNLEPRYESSLDRQVDTRVRCQGWLTFLHGGSAFIYGHSTVWRATWPDLKDVWNSGSIQNLRDMKDRLEQWEWWKLRPDLDLFDGTQSDPAHAGASASDDRVVVYVLGARTFRVKLDRLQGPVTAYRLNPADNTLSELGAYYSTDHPTFSTPDDWVDVVMMFE